MIDNENLAPEELQVQKLTTTPEIDEVTAVVKELNEIEPSEELSEKEMKEIYIQQLKNSKIRYRPTYHPTVTVDEKTITTSVGVKRVVKEQVLMTNITIPKFDNDYRKKRKKRNKINKASRKSS